MIQHIDQAVLALYTMGGVDADCAREIEAHVELCASCADSLQREARLEEALLDISGQAPCPGCERSIEGDRCAFCGAAARVGEYRVREVRVQNQHGRLYLAENAAGDRVALKELCFMQAPSFDALDAFDREARILCALHHPQMPRFISSFQAGEGVHTRLYLAQEFIDGQSLEERLVTHYFTEAEIVFVARQVLEILVFLQGKSPMVIHRDIKPANLIMRPDGKIVLVDFGAARDQGSTAGATQVGTFGFMPIEQLAGLVDASTDVYALGMSLLRLLTRREPWKLLDDPWKHTNVSPALRRVIRKMTARQPEERYPTATAALADVQALALGAPRRRVPITLVAAMVGASVLAGVVVVARLGTSEAPVPEVSKSELKSVERPPDKPVVAQPCKNSRLSRARVFDLLRQALGRNGDEVQVKELVKLVGVYRSVLDNPAADPYREHTWMSDMRFGRSLTSKISGLIDIIDGDIDATEISASVVIATGSIRVHGPITSSFLMAGGCIEVSGSGGTSRSTLLAGATVTNVNAFEDTVIAAPWIRGAFAKDSVVYGGSSFERSTSVSERAWYTILSKLESVDGRPCDEVSCVLSNYEGPCCERFRKRPVRVERDTNGNEIPEALDRAMISVGVGSVKARVMSCGDRFSAKGTVKVSVKVSPDGSISAVTVKQTPDPALGACVAAAMHKARFAKTQTGGTFGYPFVF